MSRFTLKSSTKSEFLLACLYSVCNNISLSKIKENQNFELNKAIKVIPFTVPHRDEYSETVCFLIASKQKKLLYVPDIDKWKLWDKDILQIIKSVDYALIDGTFYDETELDRDMSKIPHPFVEESMGLFNDLSCKCKIGNKNVEPFF